MTRTQALVLDYLDIRAGVTAKMVGDEFGWTPKIAGQYLGRMRHHHQWCGQLLPDDMSQIAWVITEDGREALTDYHEANANRRGDAP